MSARTVRAFDAGRPGTGAQDPDAGSALRPQQGFCHLRPRAVAGAEEEHGAFNNPAGGPAKERVDRDGEVVEVLLQLGEVEALIDIAGICRASTLRKQP
ncbi:MAG: hypothetical protein ACREOS_13170 [Candidatus Dormibacteraceae bacterium]